MDSLWGDEFKVVETKKEAKKIKEKISKPKNISIDESKPIEKRLKSKTIPLADKLKLIEQEVLRVLGKQKDNVLCIKDINSFHDYISKSIEIGRIAIDTETNNSLDPITCKLMGPCIYSPGLKQAYIPINHRDYTTGERLSWQLTEQDVKNEFQRLLDNNVKIIMHNGKFDYQVIKCTCYGLELSIDWDTMIGAKLLDENERSAGLKQQYIEKIDNSQEKYSIDNLFEGVEYADVDPEIFAFYAATDSLMTDKLYEWQMNRFKDIELSGVLNLAYTIEIPLVKVIAEMELAGMDVDQEYADLLSKKFHKRLNIIDEKISRELEKLKPKIDTWRLSTEANEHPAKKTGEGLGKSKNEQLEDPINLASPTQLAILFYDVLKCPPVSKKSPRGTGEAELEIIAEKLKLDVCKLLLDRRECVKLLTTYIDTIPELARRWPDGRVRTHFNQYGAATGRLSSSEPLNFQNIPSHEKTIRMLFKASTVFNNIEPEIDNSYTIKACDDIETPNGWVRVKNLNVGDFVKFDDSYEKINKITISDDNRYYKVYFE